MPTYLPILSVIGVGVAFAILCALHPQRWLRWLAALLLAVLFGIGVLVATIPVLDRVMSGESSLDEYFPLTAGMLAGDAAFLVGAAIAAWAPPKS
ncbi:MAG: hypothetical protein WEA54_04950 [Actinomycetota bacterium]